MGTPGFVLVHGFWHDRHTWNLVAPILEGAGHSVTVLDLPGAGENARAPGSYSQRPLDAARFATEPSPNAAVTQAERTAAVVAALEAQAARTGEKSVVVGHSMGGATVSDAAEAAPEHVAAAVYLCAFLLRPGLLPIQMIQHPKMDGALVPTLFLADPGVVGALRIDPRSEDAEYVARMHQAFAADIDVEAFEADRPHLHPDEPAGVVAHPSAVTPDRFGRLPRHYIHCLDDRAIPIAGQREMVREMDAAMGTRTTVYELKASHSPFLSQPGAVGRILLEVARQSA